MAARPRDAIAAELGRSNVTGAATKRSRRQTLAGTAALLAAPRLVRAQALETIRLCAPPTDDLTPVFWAIKTGSYQKAGLSVEFVPMTSRTAAAAALISGAYELGKGSLIALMLTHLKTLPVTIVGNRLVVGEQESLGGPRLRGRRERNDRHRPQPIHPDDLHYGHLHQRTSRRNGVDDLRVTKIALPIIQKMTRVRSATVSDPAMIQPAIDVTAKYSYIPRSFPARGLYFTGKRKESA